MREDLALDAGKVTETAVGTGSISVYTNPTPEESRELLEVLGIDDHTLASALDPDEIARIEHAGSHTFIIWKLPMNVSFRTLQMFEVSSVGIFVKADRLTLVLSGEASPVAEKKVRTAKTPWDVVLQLLLSSIHHYLDHLKVAKQMSRELQAKLNTSLSNDYLLKMFSLSESLTYYVNAIEANGGVLARLETLSDQLGMTQEQVNLLDDIVIENTQCARQSEIYASVLAGLMDARGNIINNNMNVLLKNLTIINVVFLPLGVLAGIGGMSEFTMMTRGVDWRLSYSVFLVALTALGIVLWMVLTRIVGRPRERG